MMRRESGPNHAWNQHEERRSETGFENDDNMFLEIFLEDLDDDEDGSDQVYRVAKRERPRKVHLTSRDFDRKRLRDDD